MLDGSPPKLALMNGMVYRYYHRFLLIYVMPVFLPMRHAVRITRKGGNADAGPETKRVRVR